jgi:ubiquinone/menaquinone biosynthesis C-methylase UbiE
VDTRPLIEFVRSQLPPPPARVLEIGCGEGELTRTLADAGYDMLGIDPAAPEGALFRRLKLEDLDEEERFDGVVAARTLHHVTDLEAALDKIARLLGEDGVLVVDEFAWDRLDGPTADWFHGQRRVLAAAGRLPTAPRTLADCCREWEDEHVGLHGYEAMRDALGRRFREQSFEWTPYLYRYLEGVAAEQHERTLIEADAIQAIGFRFVGVA